MVLSRWKMDIVTSNSLLVFFNERVLESLERSKFTTKFSTT